MQQLQDLKQITGSSTTSPPLDDCMLSDMKEAIDKYILVICT